MNLKDIPIDVALGMLGIPITPDIQLILDSAAKYLPSDTDPSKILIFILGTTAIKGIKAYANRLATALEAIPTELKQQTLELELQNGWIKSISDAIREHTVDINHTVR